MLLHTFKRCLIYFPGFSDFTRRLFSFRRSISANSQECLFQPRAFGFCKNSAGSTLCLDFRRPASCDLEDRARFRAGIVAEVLFKKVKIYCRKLGDMEENKLFLCEIVVKILGFVRQFKFRKSDLQLTKVQSILFARVLFDLFVAKQGA